LIVGRLVPYKKVNIIIEACNQLNLPLTVVGNGPEYQKLRKIAGPHITFVTNATDKQVTDYLASAEAFLFAAEEDFGVTPVEALASGTPVIAFKGGGALDYLVHGKNGVFFNEQSIDSLVAAIEDFLQYSFDSKAVADSAKQFGNDRFRQEIQKTLDNYLRKYSKES
jgi:glycosyltransferase involved in cell wall biosynthesis